MLSGRGVFVDPWLLVLPSMLFRSYHLSSCGFSDVITVFALFVLAVSTIDEIAQMTLIYLVFDVEVS